MREPLIVSKTNYAKRKYNGASLPQNTRDWVDELIDSELEKLRRVLSVEVLPEDAVTEARA